MGDFDGEVLVNVDMLVLKPALVLDLDGTVRYSASGTFINGPGDVRLFDGVEAKLWEYRDRGYLIFGVSNQGGVAHGYKTAWGAKAELTEMFRLFSRNPFHVVKLCYHEEKGKVWPYNVRSLLRKPDIGMLALCEVEAFRSGYVVDWAHSLVVGDRDEDKGLAERAGLAFKWADEFFGRTVPFKEPAGWGGS